MTVKPPTPFEEALDKTGNGIYNYLLVLTCGLGLLGIGVDLFGFSLMVNAACDLNITVSQKGILNSLPFIGILLVSYIWGYVSDTRGRKFSLVISMLVAFVLSSLASLSPNWIFLGVIKFVSVCFSCATNSVTYTMVGESCTQAVRSKYMVLMTCLLLLSPGLAAVFSYPVVQIDFSTDIPFLGITFKPWRLLNIILALPMGIAGVALIFFYESPKFLTNLGETEKALEILKSMYSINKRKPKEQFEIDAVIINDGIVVNRKEKPLLRAMYEQSVPLFRPPLLWRTLQLFYIVGIVYSINNTVLVWLPHIMDLIDISLSTKSIDPGSICTLISEEEEADPTGHFIYNVLMNTTTYKNITATLPTPTVCLGTIKENIVITLMGSHLVFSILNLVISYLPVQRRPVVLTVLSASTLSALLLNLVPDPIASVIFFMALACTNLVMGVMASYFVDLYPTTYRGMAVCLSIMAGRTSTFIGINIVGNVIFDYCRLTFYMGALFVFTSVIAAWFLPSEEEIKKNMDGN